MQYNRQDKSIKSLPVEQIIIQVHNTLFGVLGTAEQRDGRPGAGGTAINLLEGR